MCKVWWSVRLQLAYMLYLCIFVVCFSCNKWKWLRCCKVNKSTGFLLNIHRTQMWSLSSPHCICLQPSFRDILCCMGPLMRSSYTHWPLETWSQLPAGSPAALRLHTTREHCGLRHAGSPRWSPSHRTEWEQRGSRPAPVEQREVSLKPDVFFTVLDACMLCFNSQWWHHLWFH